MGADENAEIVQRGYEAFDSGDVKTLTELFDESGSRHTPGPGPIARDEWHIRSRSICEHSLFTNNQS